MRRSDLKRIIKDTLIEEQKEEVLGSVASEMRKWNDRMDPTNVADFKGFIKTRYDVEIEDKMQALEDFVFSKNKIVNPITNVIDLMYWLKRKEKIAKLTAKIASPGFYGNEVVKKWRAKKKLLMAEIKATGNRVKLKTKK
jgi:hypothetical protein